MSYNCLAAFYDGFTKNVNYQMRNDYMLSFFSRYGIADGILLDLACGTGKTGIAFAQKGYDVIGVDASPDMLCVARENAAKAGCGQILFLCQRMESLDLYGTIKGCVCSLDSINHLLDEAAVLAAFQRVALFMEAGGLFVFDVNTVYKHQRVLGDQTFVYETQDVFLVWQNQYDAATQIVDITLDLFERDDAAYVRETECFAERAYSIATLTHLLEQSGFQVLHVYDELSEQPPKADSERLYIIARRKEWEN